VPDPSRTASSGAGCLVSLSQQIEALRAYAAREGHEVLQEAKDPGQSEASLEHPGMDRVRDPVAAGGVYAMLAQDGDRFARGSAYLIYLREELAEHSMALRTLNDSGDGPAAPRHPPIPPPCSLARSVTTPLYSTTVSQALRQTLRVGVLRELLRTPL
jgi:hypothetical protein